MLVDEKQRIEAALYFAGWLDKLSVAFYAIGIFQPDHMFGGVIGGTILFLVGIGIKVRVTK